MRRASKARDSLDSIQDRKFHSSVLLSQSASHYSLTTTEKQFLLYAERGDCASVQKMIQEYKNKPSEFNINCADPLNRSALIIGIERENVNLILILLEAGIKMKDALLHAINEEYVEGVEVLLQWEEKTHKKGGPYSWESVDKSSSGFTLDITPVILAAHKNNYEILKLLLDRGATLPIIHDVRCGCDDCVTGKEQDSLRHSQARINAYKALTSPSLICLSSKDPLLSAIELYSELKRLEIIEAEFRVEYNSMRRTVQLFATSLLDHVRTSKELEIMLNYDPSGPCEKQKLGRLKLAIKSRLKMFVAHPNVQQLLASIWYEGLPGFRRKRTCLQIVDVLKMSFMFVAYSLAHMISPLSQLGKSIRTPFVKFICQSASYGFFLGLLALASQKVERLCYQLLDFGDPEEWMRKERGSWPGIIETLIILYVLSLIRREVGSLYADGLQEYLTDLWNILDFISNMFYLLWIGLRFTAIYIVSREHKQGINPWYPKSEWDSFDPHALSECAFASSMILSFMKLINIFSINPHLGPLQISLGRMIIDILKFFFVYTLVLFAFGCGLNQLLGFYAALEESKCYHDGSDEPDFEDADKACTVWRRFANLFETSQSLYWAGFGLVDLTTFDLTGIKSFTRFWALLIFGCYSAINIIVLINMLIAMMSNSYQIISERSDIEWKYARSKLFISFFEEDETLPPPFNLFPLVKPCISLLHCCRRKKKSVSMGINKEKADLRYGIVMQMLIRRYVTAEQKKIEEFAVTEDDIAEVRHDISSFRFELLDLFRKNNFIVPEGKQLSATHGRKERILERRINKDFQIGIVDGVVNDTKSTDKSNKNNIFDKIARAVSRNEGKKNDWNLLVRSSSLLHDPIGNTNESQRKLREQNIRKYILQYHEASPMNMDSEKLVEYNPQLSRMSHLTRIAYAKFKMNLIKKEYEGLRDFSVDKGLFDAETFASSRANSVTSNQSLKMSRETRTRSITKTERSLSSAFSKHAEIINIPSAIEENISHKGSLKSGGNEELSSVEKQSKMDDSVIVSVPAEASSSPLQPSPAHSVYQSPFLRGKCRAGNWL